MHSNDFTIILNKFSSIFNKANLIIEWHDLSALIVYKANLKNVYFV